MHCGILIKIPYWMSNSASLNSECTYNYEIGIYQRDFTCTLHCNWLLYVTSFFRLPISFLKMYYHAQWSGLNTLPYPTRSSWIPFAWVKSRKPFPFHACSKRMLRIWPIALRQTQAKEIKPGVKLTLRLTIGPLWQQIHRNKDKKNRSNLNHIWSICLHCMFMPQSRGSNSNTGKMDQTRFRSNLPAEDGMSFLTLNTTVPLSCRQYIESRNLHGYTCQRHAIHYNVKHSWKINEKFP